MLDNTIARHPALSASPVLQALLQPLRKFGIDYFAMTAVKQGEFYGVISEGKWFEHYLEKGYYKFDMYINSDNEKVTKNMCLAWDELEGTASFRQAYQASADHGASHLFSISQAAPEVFYTFFFGTSSEQADINQFYYNNIDLLLRFIALVKEKILTNKLLQAAMTNSLFALPSQIEPEVIVPANVYSNNEKIIDAPLQKFMLEGLSEKKSLSMRELQCLYWLGEAKTNQQTAQLMNCSQRMVEEYIVKLKQKLDCKSLFQLGEKVVELNIQPILHP